LDQTWVVVNFYIDFFFSRLPICLLGFAPYGIILRKGSQVRIKRISLLGAIFTFFILALSLPAHHGPAAFDLTKNVSGTGKVTVLEWVNPHVILHVDLKDDKGNVKNWAIEMYNPLTMRRAGWDKDILKAGDDVSVTFHPAKNGNTMGYVREGDGKIISKGKELMLSSNGQ
jgi:Family of unknown function (DUF6152)